MLIASLDMLSKKDRQWQKHDCKNIFFEMDVFSFFLITGLSNVRTTEIQFADDLKLKTSPLFSDW